MLADCYHDHTVRPPIGESWLHDNLTSGPAPLDGPDLSTAQGAAALARRLESFWAMCGEPRLFSSYYVSHDQSGDPVFGVLDVTPQPASRKVEPVGPTPRQRVKTLVRATLKNHPETSYEVLMRHRRGRQGRRAAHEFAARTACIKAVKREFGFDNEQVARIFAVDRTTVLLALGQKSREYVERGIVV